RELLLGGGEESTIRRRNLQTKTGMTSAAESITESLRRSRQIMVQEVERSANTLATFVTGHLVQLTSDHTLLYQNRVILAVGFLVFLSAVLYVVSKRIGLLYLQRKITAAIKAGSGAREIGKEIQGVGDGMNGR
ncbi:hypothetical protein BHE74_00017620, partial [Ensete ventricosum]